MEGHGGSIGLRKSMGRRSKIGFKKVRGIEFWASSFV